MECIKELCYEKIIYFLVGIFLVPLIFGIIMDGIARKNEYDAYIGF